MAEGLQFKRGSEGWAQSPEPIEGTSILTPSRHSAKGLGVMVGATSHSRLQRQHAAHLQHSSQKFRFGFYGSLG